MDKLNNRAKPGLSFQLVMRIAPVYAAQLHSSQKLHKLELKTLPKQLQG